MPLSCLRNGLVTSSLDYDLAGWERLREENASNGELRLACCGSNPVLKTSRLGTRFFAHRGRSACTEAGETAEHLFAKACIAQAVGKTDWIAEVEARGKAPDGSRWIADVLATRGKSRVAFEVQWSPQSREETRRRQELYQAAQVRTLWVFRRPQDVVVSQCIPAGLLEVDLPSKTAWIRLAATERACTHRPDSDASDGTWSAQIELGRFIRGALSGRLHWAPNIDQEMPLQLYAAETPCVRCARPTVFVTDAIFRPDQLMLGSHPHRFSWNQLRDAAGADALLAALRRDLRIVASSEGRRCRTPMPVPEHLAYGLCHHCGALHSAAFIASLSRWATVYAMTESCLPDAFKQARSHWSFDETFERYGS